jgi:hypothetical protein
VKEVEKEKNPKEVACGGREEEEVTQEAWMG